MDELKIKRLEHEVISILKEQGCYHLAFDTIINIYAEMLIQRETLENQISNRDNPEGNRILMDVLTTLNETIKAYEVQLCLNPKS